MDSSYRSEFIRDMEAIDHKSSSSEDVPCTDTSCAAECSSTAHSEGDDVDLCESEAVDLVPVATCAGSASQEETNMKKLLSKLKRSDGKIAENEISRILVIPRPNLLQISHCI